MQPASINMIQEALLHVPGVTQPKKGRLIIIEVTSEICSEVAKILQLPDSACLGLPQFLGALTARNIRTEKLLDHGKVMHLAYLDVQDIDRLLPG